MKLADLAGVDPTAKGTLLLEKHLNEHLDGIYRALKPPDDIAARRMFKQLGEYDGKGRLVRRNCELPALAAVCERTPAEMLGVVNQFRNEKLGRTFLMPPEESTQALLNGDEPLDISHEALLRRWELLRSWVGEEAKDADEFRSLAGRAAKHGAALRGLELAQAGRWVRKFKPTPVWARRYAGVTEDPARAALRLRPGHGILPAQPQIVANSADLLGSAGLARSCRSGAVRQFRPVAAGEPACCGVRTQAYGRIRGNEQSINPGEDKPRSSEPQDPKRAGARRGR